LFVLETGSGGGGVSGGRGVVQPAKNPPVAQSEISPRKALLSEVNCICAIEISHLIKKIEFT
jgi:hypothetical protein